MKRLLILASALFTVSVLSAQTYKVGDYYNVDGKKGVVFEVSEDGKHGKIFAETQTTEKMTWYKAMEWIKGLKDGWYIPSFEEFETLSKMSNEIGEKFQDAKGKLPNFSWTTTEFDTNCAWCISMRQNGKGAFYKGNKFGVCIISKF